MSTESARKAAHAIWMRSYELASRKPTVPEDEMAEIIAAACQTVAPPPDAEKIAERQAEQIAILFNGDLSGGTSIRNVLANVLRVALGAAPAVPTPPLNIGCDAHPNGPVEGCSGCAWINRSGARCPKCGHNMLAFNYSTASVICDSCRAWFPVSPNAILFPLSDFAQFFRPAPSPPQWISVKERLPEYGELVLMWFVTVNPANSGVVLGSRSIHEKGKYWDCGGLYRDFEHISHWQPLPVPPVASPQGEPK